MQPDETTQPPRPNPWWLVLFLSLLLLACLALITVNTDAGFRVDGQQAHYRLESAITNYPFCPPSVPCPISAILNENHWVVFVVRDVRSPSGIQTDFRKLVDIPLWR